MEAAALPSNYIPLAAINRGANLAQKNIAHSF
jgi:hypothetical protein